ncbi:T9SS type A sorting domain-containing protein, partial [Marine Group I thaumarchaeote]|nr:T9SS type A sorting domain-containing protein [Marine Group I thaumarchaeote]
SDCGCVDAGNSGDDCDDCNGTPNGSATDDSCEECSGGNSGHDANSDKDCNGDCFGTALEDSCGECSGGNSDHLAEGDIDCNGDCFGTATLDSCEECSGGNSGHLADSDIDDFGLCFNGNSLQGAINSADAGGIVTVPGGTYDETATINKTLTLTGSGSITGGVVIAADDVTVDGLSLSGEPSQKSTVIFVDGSTVRNNVTISNCTIDGESTGKYAFYGSNALTGDLSFDGNTIQNISTWYVIDNTTSGSAANALDNVVFSNNTLVNVTGSIAFRGMVTDPMTSATINNNIANDSGTLTDFWAFVEVDNSEHVEAVGNEVHGLQGLEGSVSWETHQVFQFWSQAGDWSVDIHDNDLSGNEIGIAIATGGAFFVPSGSIYDNDFSDNIIAITAETWGPGDGDCGDDPGARVNAENNYFGNTGPISDWTSSTATCWVDAEPFYLDADMTTLAAEDCAGTWDGSATDDSCGECSGGNSGHEADSDQDCNGDCFGDSYEDDGGTCDNDVSNDCAQYSIELDRIDLVSFYALPDDNSIGNVLSGIEGLNPGVLGEGTSAIFVNNLGWIGGLLSIDQQDGYWIKVTGETDLNVEGLPTDPGTVYSLHGGSNLISYPFAGSAPIVETIPEDAQSSIIGIIAEGDAAYNSEEGWVGLMDLSGTEGYWFITSEDVEFVYNPPASDNNLTRQTKSRKMLPEAYFFAQSTQQAFYFVKSAEIDGIPLDVNDLIIAYNGDVVVGARYWYGETTDVPAMGTDGSTIYAGYGEAGDKITFKVLDASTNSLIDMESEGETTWQNLGMSVIQLTNKVIPEEISFSSAYPNPFNPVTMVSMSIPTEMEVHVTIHDMLGREIAKLANGVYSTGNYELHWDASYHASGIYFVKMIAGGQTNIQKLMLIK